MRRLRTGRAGCTGTLEDDEIIINQMLTNDKPLYPKQISSDDEDFDVMEEYKRIVNACPEKVPCKPVKIGKYPPTGRPSFIETEFI